MSRDEQQSYWDRCGAFTSKVAEVEASWRALVTQFEDADEYLQQAPQHSSQHMREPQCSTPQCPPALPGAIREGLPPSRRTVFCTVVLYGSVKKEHHLLLQQCILDMSCMHVQADLCSMAKGIQCTPPMARQDMPNSGQGPGMRQLNAHRLVHPGYIQSSHARL